MWENGFKNIVYRIKDRISSRKYTEKSVYLDLTPIDSLNKERESIKALHWAMLNPEIKNIALTGPYGAGKSSIIKSYLKQYPKCKAIDLSLATFDGRSWDKIQDLLRERQYDDAHNVQKEFEDEIEKGILKQLFYKVDADKIPLSRYRKLHHKNLQKYVVGVMLLMLFILSGMYLVFPDDVILVLNSYRNGITSFREGTLRIGAFLVVLLGMSWVIRFVTSKFTIKEISVGDISAQGEEASDDSVLNRNIDEMLYFFERTKYNVVFIEDLDRFNSTSVFIKLREINTILNNYDVIKRRGKITFVYAVKDNLFQEETERTKFFDFLIPVIPVINSTNSGEVMRDLLGMGEKRDFKKEYPEHTISPQFVTLVSPYIGDMRILISTINEFWIYKITLKESQDVHLKDENMLALMIYKNIYPKDFSLLEMESGNVKDAFKYKATAIRKMQENLECKKKELDTEISQLQRDIAESIKEIKIIILSELTGNEGVVSRITISSQTYDYRRILEDAFSLDVLRFVPIRVYYRPYNAYGEIQRNFSKLSDSDGRIMDLFQRYDRQRKYLSKSADDIKKEFERIDKEITTLRAKTVQQLIESNSLEDVLPENVRKNNLLVFMLRHGYINESYADYINYFHAGSISKEELNFILGIRNFSRKDSSELEIRHCANVINQLYDYEFEQVEVLNYNLTDHLIEDKSNQDKLDMLIKQLINQSETSLKFIKSYIDRGKNKEQFIGLLCHKSPYVWVHFMYDEHLSKEKKNEYLKLIIKTCELYDIEKNNVGYEDEEGVYCEGVIREYIENEENILLEMSDVPWGKIKQVIDELGIKFYNLSLDGLTEQVINDIIAERYFELNHVMMKSICRVMDTIDNEKFFKCNYQWLCELNNESLIGYVHDEFVAYVYNLIINQETNTEEETRYVDDILHRIFKEDRNLCIAVIEKEHLAYWKNLSDCLMEFEDNEKQIIWDYLLLNNRTDATWENYLTYHELFGLSNVLLQFLDDNIDTILENSVEDDVSDEIVKELIVSDMSDIGFEKLISKYKVDKFTNKCDDFTKRKLQIMIQKHYFEFSPERFAELKGISQELSREFICENLSEFVGNMEHCKMDLTDIKDVIKLQILDKNELLALLKLMDSTDIDKEFALLAKDFEFTLPKEYVEAMWQVLDEVDRCQILYVQMEVFDLDELAEKFKELGGVYNQFASRAKHKFTLRQTDFNQALCKKLMEREFLSSYEITVEKVGTDHITFEDIYENQITGYVRKKAEKQQ